MKTLAPKDATKELVAQVQQILGEVEGSHTYSVSRIYSAHNKITGQDEIAQSCSSCLIARHQAIKNWYDEYLKATVDADALKAVKVTGDKAKVKSDNTVDTGAKAPVLGAELKVKEGASLFFTANEGDDLKGVVSNAEGKGVKPGTYALEDGREVAVQVGNKASIKVPDLN